ncbi:hypothetical protein BDZ45DRAFT_798773 [Acephala macrosclerotiorum]|nr:hypothetical protein BDZ45DRAFT_798773 [Acephala macrosclerotiorum]
MSHPPKPFKVLNNALQIAVGVKDTMFKVESLVDAVQQAASGVQSLSRLQRSKNAPSIPVTKRTNSDTCDGVFETIAGYQICSKIVSVFPGRGLAAAIAMAGKVSAEHPTCMPQSSTLSTRVLFVGSSTQEPYLYETQGDEACYRPLTTMKASLSSHMQSIPMSTMPQTFLDGILVTRKLGINYLWIDSLCIVQDNAEDWAKEAAPDGAKDSTCGLFDPVSKRLFPGSVPIGPSADTDTSPCERDRLPALSGIAGVTKVDAKDDYVCGHWKSDLPESLLWMSYATGNISYGKSESQKAQMKMMCEILEISTVLASSNPFGPLKSGFIKIRGHMGQLPQRRYFGNGTNRHQPWLLSSESSTRRVGRLLRGRMKADVMAPGFEFVESDELQLLILASKTEVDESFEGLAGT